MKEKIFILYSKRLFEGGNSQEILRLRQTNLGQGLGQRKPDAWGDRETLDRGCVHSERDRGREMLTSQYPQDLSVLYPIQDAPRDLVHVS